MNIAETLRKQQENTGYLEGVRNVLMGVISPSGGSLTTLIHEANAIKVATDATREKFSEYEVGNSNDIIDFFPQRIDEVYDAGKQAHEDWFWDIYQNYGKRTSYEFAFAQEGWNDETFKPKYDMNLSYWGGTQMFFSSKITNLKGMLGDLGITIDFSNCHSFRQIFQSSQTKQIPALDLSNADAGTAYAFSSTNLEYIEKIISSAKTKYEETTFNGATALTDVTFEGIIARAVDIHWSPLNKASIKSIINALSTTTNGLTLTLSKSAKEQAFTDEEWASLIATKQNWTISLATT